MNIRVTELIWPEGREELETSGCVAYDPDLRKRPSEVADRGIGSQQFTEVQKPLQMCKLCFECTCSNSRKRPCTGVLLV
jgi:hypothetical protein